MEQKLCFELIITLHTKEKQTHNEKETIRMISLKQIKPYIHLYLTVALVIPGSFINKGINRTSDFQILKIQIPPCQITNESSKKLKS